jgi:hypothetical protein
MLQASDFGSLQATLARSPGSGLLFVCSALLEGRGAGEGIKGYTSLATNCGCRLRRGVRTEASTTSPVLAYQKPSYDYLTGILITVER